MSLLLGRCALLLPVIYIYCNQQEPFSPSASPFVLPLLLLVLSRHNGKLQALRPTGSFKECIYVFIFPVIALNNSEKQKKTKKINKTNKQKKKKDNARQRKDTKD